jgi:hypothetical protein
MGVPLVANIRDDEGAGVFEMELAHFYSDLSDNMVHLTRLDTIRVFQSSINDKLEGHSSFLRHLEEPFEDPLADRVDILLSMTIFKSFDVPESLISRLTTKHTVVSRVPASRFKEDPKYHMWAE